MLNKRTVKEFLGELPMTAEIYWRLHQGGQPLNEAFSLRKLEAALPGWREQAVNAVKNYKQSHDRKQKVVLFCTLRYWIEHAILMGLGLAGLGHEVTFLYLPYANWQKALNRFDQRQQNSYARNALQKATPIIQPLSLLDINPIPKNSLPKSLINSLEEVSVRDTQYTLQVEELNHDNNSEASRLYNFRLARNTQAAGAMLAWLKTLSAAQYPDIFIIPNGSILEMGAVYQTARSLDIPVVTYEFGEQRDRIWLSKNSEIMLQKTEPLWDAHKDRPLNEIQWQKIKALYESRQKANLWENFSRKWQGSPSQGGEKVRAELGLDSRPIILLAANVIGDSLTLGRQTFSKNMTEWLAYTARRLAQFDKAQLVIRIHPGERFIEGPSVADIIHQTIDPIPSHIHLVDALDPINTYDLVDIADLGLVYTTTVGLEMAMSGIPVIVVGQTHYRDKGFTLDPNSWDSYQQKLDEFINNPQIFTLSHYQVEQAWNYAYHFFFDFPCAFPWHLKIWKDVERWPIQRVLSNEGIQQYGDTFQYLVGKQRAWTEDAIIIGNTH